MKRSVNNLKSNQPEMLSKRAEKKRVNLPWNHSLFFQVGLVVSLLTVFFVMESSFKVKANPIVLGGSSISEEPFAFNDFIIDVPKVLKASKREVIKPVRPTIAKPISTVIEVSSNESKIDETNTASTDDPIVSDPPKTENPLDEGNMNPKNILGVEFVPIFPGCESLATNEARVACMSSKIGAFVQRKFRTENFDNLDSEKIHKVYVNFKIDSKGEITDIKARAANRELEAEGKRVIGKLPKMKPGKQGSVNVDVLYTVPITFKVE